MSRGSLVVIAKVPEPGRAKTRLSPPCTGEEAARLAEAALADTLVAVAAARASRHVLALDGPDIFVPEGFEVIRQRGDGLDERLARALEDVGGPALVVGMDTPQLTPELLDDALDTFEDEWCDAVLGPATDGGYWCIGLRSPVRDAIEGVPMSRADTFARQLERLELLGMRCRVLGELRDVDTFEDACAVAEVIPHSRFAQVLSTIGSAPTS